MVLLLEEWLVWIDPYEVRTSRQLREIGAPGPTVAEPGWRTPDLGNAFDHADEAASRRLCFDLF